MRSRASAEVHFNVSFSASPLLHQKSYSYRYMGAATEHSVYFNPLHLVHQGVIILLLNIFILGHVQCFHYHTRFCFLQLW